MDPTGVVAKCTINYFQSVLRLNCMIFGRLILDNQYRMITANERVTLTPWVKSALQFCEICTEKKPFIFHLVKCVLICKIARASIFRVDIKKCLKYHAFSTTNKIYANFDYWFYLNYYYYWYRVFYQKHAFWLLIFFARGRFILIEFLICICMCRVLALILVSFLFWNVFTWTLYSLDILCNAQLIRYRPSIPYIFRIQCLVKISNPSMKTEITKIYYEMFTLIIQIREQFQWM